MMKMTGMLLMLQHVQWVIVLSIIPVIRADGENITLSPKDRSRLELMDKCSDVEKYINTTGFQFTLEFCPEREKNDLERHVYDCFNKLYMGCEDRGRTLGCKYEEGKVKMFCANQTTTATVVAKSGVTPTDPTKIRSFPGYGSPLPQRKGTAWIGFGTLCTSMFVGALVLMISCVKSF